MSPQQRSRLRQEVELIGRFAQSYHKKMAELIGRLNGPPSSSAKSQSTDGSTMRLCVEAVDMMLATQQQLAAALWQITSDLADDSTTRRAVAV
jgi:hypothetical protein